MVYNFILNCWKLGKITESDVKAFVTKGFISQLQAEDILSEPQEVK